MTPLSYSILDLLDRSYEEKISDLHITVGVPPMFRKNGKLIPGGEVVLTEEMTKQMVNELLPADKQEEFAEKGETDFGFALGEKCRFRINAYHQQKRMALAARQISNSIPTLQQLNMPKVLYDLAERPQGLILVTGPTGSGKSTTLAAMIDHINRTMSRHILTLEDPIEYVHPHNQSIVNQREIGADSMTFANALRAALRQDPDVILVGEMRDLETISTAITAAETGHLVMGTLHTSSAPTTIDRIIDVFPPFQQGQIRIQLGNVLQGIVSQRLFVNATGNGRVAATEILISTPAVSNLIRNEKVHQIQNVMQTSRALGMHTLEANIQELITKGYIKYEDAKPYLPAGDY